MYKRLRIYYFYTALPFLILLLGAAVFSGAIMRTLEGNPHPQINYAIFAVTLLGGLLILRGVHSVLKEAQLLETFSTALKGDATAEQLLDMARNWDAEISYVLRMIAATVGRSLSHQEQSAIEHELHSAQARLEARHALPQFLTSLLVGLGLLGTFVGLLSALGDIGKMVSSFGALDVASADLMEVFRGMVQRMEAPMASMAIAFSASMFGLLGSIVLGFMMVSARGLVRELHSLLGSEVSQHLNLALAKMGPATLAKVVENMSSVLNSSIDRLARELEVNFSQLSASLAGVDQKVRTTLDGVAAVGDAGEPSHPLRDLLADQNALLQRLESRLVDAASLQGEAVQQGRELVLTQRSDFDQLVTQNASLVEGMRKSIEDVIHQMTDSLVETRHAVERSGQDLAATLASGAMSVKLSETPEGLERLPEMLSKVSNAITLSASRIELASRELTEKGMGGGMPMIVGNNDGGTVTLGGGVNKEAINEQIDLLRRIDERLAENHRTQSSALQTEFESINRTRSEMSRVFNEHAEAMAMLRSELQRIGRQLGIAHALMERSSTGVMDMLNERFAEQNNSATRQSEQLAGVGDAISRVAEDSAQNLRLLGEILERARTQEMRALITEVIAAIRQVASLQIDLGMKIEQAQMDSADQIREAIKTQRDALKSLASPKAE